MNFYRFANNTQKWSDPTGLNPLVIGGYEAFMYLLAVTGIYTIAVNSQDDGTVWPTSNDEESQSSNQSTTDISNCSKTESGCPPCSPYPVGTLGYIGPRIVQRGADGARNNDGVGIPHFKVFAVQQNPKDCTCRWQQTQKVMQIYGHHTKFIPSGAIDLNGKGDPPSYP